ncbi:MAG: hypothetical protein HQL76_11045 [Magnetococcales bacterium]|nr:hypothetical protein [Magnetococcales bacterium]
MVIDGAGQLALLSYLDAKRNQDSARKSDMGLVRADSVDFSAAALAQAVGTQQTVAMPQLLVNEEVVRWNMARIFMDTLFGDSADGEENKQDESVETMVTEASFDALLEEASRDVENGRV